MSSKIMTRFFSPRALLAAVLGLTALLGLTAAPAQAEQGTWPVHVWASQVRVRTCDGTSCGLATTERLTNVTVQAICQRWGGYVSDGPYYNHYWVEIITPHGTVGWVSAVYVSGGNNDEPVPALPEDSDCR